jgi:hypothetical protein
MLAFKHPAHYAIANTPYNIFILLKLKVKTPILMAVTPERGNYKTLVNVKN